MFIHTVERGETLYNIARKYGVCATKIIENNAIADPDRLSVGQKLLILTPTRTYTVRGGDTLEKISKRFGVGYRSLLRANPRLAGRDAAYPTEVLAIKYDAPTHGAAVTCGYYYKGCTEKRLMMAMPYAAYVAISAYTVSHGRLTRIFDDKEVIRQVKAHGRIPLMRVYDPRECTEVLSEAPAFIKMLKDTASNAGYCGIILGAHTAMLNSEYGRLLLELKRELMDEGLLLITEQDGSEASEICDIADACVLMYEKCAGENIPSFKDGEARHLTDYAEAHDSTKGLIYLSPFAFDGKRAITHKEAQELAYKKGKSIEYDEERKICHFEYTKFHNGEREPVRVAYEAPENIKAKLDLGGELGYMGICFDIMRVPTEHLMMCAACYAPSNYTLSSFGL